MLDEATPGANHGGVFRDLVCSLFIAGRFTKSQRRARLLLADGGCPTHSYIDMSGIFPTLNGSESVGRTLWRPSRLPFWSTRRLIMIHHRPQGFDHDFFPRSLSGSAAVGGSMASSASWPVSRGNADGAANVDSDGGRAEVHGWKANSGKKQTVRQLHSCIISGQCRKMQGQRRNPGWLNEPGQGCSSADRFRNCGHR
jgi:hypothetical protein